jgi:hypothetical protein
VRTDPGDQLVERERLRDVVASTELEPAQLRGQVAARREDDHGQLRALLAELAEDRQAVRPRQQQIEHDESDVLVARPLESVRAVRGDVHGEPLRFEPPSDESGDARLVLDHQDSHCVARYERP